MRRRHSPSQIAVGALLLILMLPIPSLLYQQVDQLATHGPTESGLTGVVAPQQDQLKWTWQAWFSGELQKRFASWYADNLGPARKILIRLTNGIYYLAFDRSLSSNAEIVIGKRRMLFQQVYVRDACGLGGGVDLEALQRSLRAARQALAGRGIAFAMVISPSKAAVYPQFIPGRYCTGLSRQRAYDRLLPVIAAGAPPIIDGHAITVAAQAASPWPLFARDGLHWNHLGALPTLQPLLALIERQLGRPLVHLKLDRVDVDDHPTWYDSDLGHLLNLPFPLHPYPTPHAVIGHDAMGRPIRILFVGTSFLWVPFDILAQNGVMSGATFYSYYREIFRIDRGFGYTGMPPARDDSVSARDDLNTEIGKVDAVVLEVNEAFVGHSYVTEFLDDVARLAPAAATPGREPAFGSAPGSEAN
jgi:alginate O-acetyltransferase complex protein AlgJ